MYSWLRDWHAEQGSALSIVLYPSDQFGNQELPAAEIPSFVKQYLEGDEIHLMAKVHVNGAKTDPVWQFLKTAHPGDVRWNFDAIFLIDQVGEPVGRYGAKQLKNVDADLKYLLTQSGWS